MSFFMFVIKLLSDFLKNPQSSISRDATPTQKLSLLLYCMCFSMITTWSALYFFHIQDIREDIDRLKVSCTVLEESQIKVLRTILEKI
jgi:membrane protein CcdC involved in cytochrome C biogenesis